MDVDGVTKASMEECPFHLPFDAHHHYTSHGASLQPHRLHEPYVMDGFASNNDDDDDEEEGDEEVVMVEERELEEK